MHACSQCNKQFSTASNRNRHSWSVHTRVFPHCKRCNKTFSRIDSLARHELQCEKKSDGIQLGGGNIFEDTASETTEMVSEGEEETEDEDEEEEHLTKEDLEAFRILLQDVKDEYTTELNESLEADAKARRQLREKWIGIIKDTYETFLRATKLMKKSPLHKEITESIREQREKGKSFHRAIKIAMMEYEDMLEKLLPQEEESSEDMTTDEEE